MEKSPSITNGSELPYVVKEGIELWVGPGDEPLMKILATPEEVAAVEEAIVHYLDYVKCMPDMSKEDKEAVILLKRLQQRLAHPPEQGNSRE